MVVGWKLQFTNVLLAAVNPGTWSFSCIALLEKRLTIHRKLSKLIALMDSVKAAELSVVLKYGHYKHFEHLSKSVVAVF